MLVLDTNHLVEFDFGSSLGAALRRRLDVSGQDVATTIVSAEEQLRGWLAQINRIKSPSLLIEPYARLRQRLEFFANWNVLQWDAAAAEHFIALRKAKVRIGTMDLRIASIVLANNATLLSRNTADFAQVPELHCEDWLSQPQPPTR